MKIESGLRSTEAFLGRAFEIEEIEMFFVCKAHPLWGVRHDVVVAFIIFEQNFEVVHLVPPPPAPHPTAFSLG